MSEAVTNHIRVEVLARYSPEDSQPFQDEWMFEYTVLAGLPASSRNAGLVS